MKDNGCTTLECDHSFHTICIKVFCGGFPRKVTIVLTFQKWMEKKKDGSTCPNCRSFAP